MYVSKQTSWKSYSDQGEEIKDEDGPSNQLEELKQVEALLAKCISERSRRERAMLESRALIARVLRREHVYDFKVPEHLYSFFKIEMEEKQGFWIKLDKRGGDCSLYVTNSEEGHPTKDDHTWALSWPQLNGCKALRISKNDSRFKACTFILGVLGENPMGRQNVHFRISWGFKKGFLESKGLREIKKFETLLTPATRARLVEIKSQAALVEGILSKTKGKPNRTKDSHREEEEKEENPVEEETEETGKSKECRAPALLVAGSIRRRESFMLKPMLKMLGRESQMRLALGLRVILKACARAAALQSLCGGDIGNSHSLANLIAAGIEFESQEAAETRAYKQQRAQLVKESKLRYLRQDEDKEGKYIFKDPFVGQSDTLRLRERDRLAEKGTKVMTTTIGGHGLFHSFLSDRHYHPTPFGSNKARVSRSNFLREKPQTTTVVERVQFPQKRPATSTGEPHKSPRRRPATAGPLGRRAFCVATPFDTDEVTGFHPRGLMKKQSQEQERHERVLDCSEKDAHLSLAPLFCNQEEDTFAVGGLCFADGVATENMFCFVPVFDGTNMFACEIGVIRERSLGTLQLVVRIHVAGDKREYKYNSIAIIPRAEWVDFMCMMKAKDPRRSLTVFVNGKKSALVPQVVFSDQTSSRTVADTSEQTGSAGAVYLSKILVWKNAHSTSGTAEGSFEAFAEYNLARSIKPTQFADQCANHHDAFANGGAKLVVRVDHLCGSDRSKALAGFLFGLFEKTERSKSERAKRIQHLLQLQRPELGWLDSAKNSMATCKQLAEQEKLDVAYAKCCDCVRMLESTSRSDDEKQLLQGALSLKQRLLEALRWRASPAAQVSKYDPCAIIRLPEFIWVERRVKEDTYSHFAFKLESFQNILIELAVEDGDPDLYVNCSESKIIPGLPAFPTYENYTWASAGDGEDEIRIRARDENLRLGFLLISVHGATRSQFRIRVKFEEQTDEPFEKQEASDLEVHIDKECQGREKYWFAKLSSRHAG